MRVGNQAPRLRSVPAYSSTLGDEAIDLAAAAGLLLDPWQQVAVRDVLGVDEFGQWAAMESCTVVARQLGKGAIIETVELGGLFLFGERLILHSAHEYKTAQEAFLRIKALIDGCSDLSRHVKAIREANGEQQVILMDGARLRFVARSKGSGRGFSAQRNILDEAYALTRAQIAALLPTMSAQPNPQINMFSTVPDLDTMPADVSEAVLPAVYKRAVQAAKSGAPGRLCYHDWSIRREELPKGDPLTDPVVFEQYIELAYEANPALGIRISEEYVRGELAALGSAKFAVERLSVWLDLDGAGWLVIPQPEWQAAADPSFDHPSPVAFAITVDEGQQWGAICAAGPIGLGDDGRPLFGIVVLDRRPGTGWMCDRLFALADRWEPVITICDRNSPANEVWSEVENANLARAGSADLKQLELTPISARDVAAAAAGLFTGIAGLPALDEETGLWVNPRNVRHQDQDVLNRGVAGAIKRVTSSGAYCFDPLLTDPVVKGCAEALWGYKSRPEPIAEPWAFSL